MVQVALHDEQLLGNAIHILQDKFELFYRNRLAQVGVDHQYTVGADAGVAGSQKLRRNVVFWLQHRADGRYLRGFIGNEMNEHLSAKSGKTVPP